MLFVFALAVAVFEAVAAVDADDEEPPEPTTEEASWRRVLAAAAVQGLIFRVTKVTVDRYGAIGWRHLTGTWPGEKRPDPD